MIMKSGTGMSRTDILEKAVPLFAEAGFNGVSMRAIARAVNLNVATLYHHFSDKRTLYIAALAHAFAPIGHILSEALNSAVAPEARLKAFTTALCRLIHEDLDFGKLVQRELLAADDERLRLMAEQVFHDFFTSLLSLCRELAPAYDPHLLAISIIGLMVYHYQSAPLRRYQPGRKPEHNDPEVVAEHVTRLLLQGILESKGQALMERSIPENMA
jgi:AcrR family transcriptional regulator